MSQLIVIQRVRHIRDIYPPPVLGVIQDCECALRDVLSELAASSVRNVTGSDVLNLIPEVLRSQQVPQPFIITLP
ncbi:hypothetical protein FKM82_029464 [Ascaphus truei]